MPQGVWVQLPPSPPYPVVENTALTISHECSTGKIFVAIIEASSTLKIDKQIQPDHQARLVVETEKEQMDVYKRRAAQKLAQSGKIPGFRPGKAPYEIILRNYGEAAINEKAVDLFIDEEYTKMLEQAEIKPGSSGTLESVDSYDPPKFTFLVPLAPEVDLGNYHAIRLPYKWTAPGVKQVEAAIEDLRQMYATTENAERTAQIGDYVLLDVKSENSELNRTGFAAFIRKEPRDTEWPFNGFARELIGLNPGEIKTVKHKFPKDWEIEDLRGKSVDLEITLKTVRSVTLPDLDDEFAKTTGIAQNLEDLKIAVTKDVEARSKADYDDEYFVELIEKIKKGAQIQYAPQTLDHEGGHVLEDLSQRLAQQNMDLETYFKVRQTTREKFIEEEVKPAARKRLERSLILDEIIRMENLEVDNTTLDQEFNATVSNLARQGLNFNNIRGGKQGKQRVAEALAVESASRLLTRQALEVLKSIANGEYKKVDKEKTKATAEAVDTSEGKPG